MGLKCLWTRCPLCSLIARSILASAALGSVGSLTLRLRGFSMEPGDKLDFVEWEFFLSVDFSGGFVLGMAREVSLRWATLLLAAGLGFCCLLAVWSLCSAAVVFCSWSSHLCRSVVKDVDRTLCLCPAFAESSGIPASSGLDLSLSSGTPASSGLDLSLMPILGSMGYLDSEVAESGLAAALLGGEGGKYLVWYSARKNQRQSYVKCVCVLLIPTAFVARS